MKVIRRSRSRKIVVTVAPSSEPTVIEILSVDFRSMGFDCPQSVRVVSVPHVPTNDQAAERRDSQDVTHPNDARSTDVAQKDGDKKQPPKTPSDRELEELGLDLNNRDG